MTPKENVAAELRKLIHSLKNASPEEAEVGINAIVDFMLYRIPEIALHKFLSDIPSDKIEEWVVAFKSMKDATVSINYQSDQK